jgi:hypothetical protein
MIGTNRVKPALSDRCHAATSTDRARKLGLLLMLSSCAVSLGTVGAAAVFLLHL